MSLTVNFTDQSTPGPSGPITAWEWDFGDGNTSTSQNPTHAYSAPGTYSVSLTVTGTGGDGTASISHTEVVTADVAIAAAFTVATSALVATFADHSTPGPSGPITAWAWDFGDTNTSTVANPTHTYAAAGTYQVQLTVTGTGGDGTSVVTHTVVVVAAGGTSFDTVTNWPRPSFTPVRTVNFSTKAQLDAAIADMQPGDLIKYNGTGVLTISSNTGNAYKLENLNPASLVVIDFGTRATTQTTAWGAPTSGNYVRFQYTGTSQWDAMFITKCSNLRIYGGEYTTGNAGNCGFRMFGGCKNVLAWDQYVNLVGNTGVGLPPIDSHTGDPLSIDHCSFRIEVNRCCMNPNWDPHADKGTGSHGCIIHGNSGHFDNNLVCISAHDPLQPGESSVGQVWPEGAGGSVIEVGTDIKTGLPASSTSQNNNTYYAKGKNFKMLVMRPGTVNPGSTISQTGGNLINAWGSVPLNGNVFEWLEGDTCTGNIFHGAGNNWKTANPAIKVNHGRAHNMCLDPNYGGHGTNPYPVYSGQPVYSDCTVV